MNSMTEQELSRNTRSKFQLQLLLKEALKAALRSDHSKQPQNNNKPSTDFKSQKSFKYQTLHTSVNKGFKGNRPTGAGSQQGQSYNQPFREGCFICGGPHLARA